MKVFISLLSIIFLNTGTVLCQTTINNFQKASLFITDRVSELTKSHYKMVAIELNQEFPTTEISNEIFKGLDTYDISKDSLIIEGLRFGNHVNANGLKNKIFFLALHRSQYKSFLQNKLILDSILIKATPINKFIDRDNFSYQYWALSIPLSVIESSYPIVHYKIYFGYDEEPSIDVRTVEGTLDTKSLPVYENIRPYYGLIVYLKVAE